MPKSNIHTYMHIKAPQTDEDCGANSCDALHQIHTHNPESADMQDENSRSLRENRNRKTGKLRHALLEKTQNLTLNIHPHSSRPFLRTKYIEEPVFTEIHFVWTDFSTTCIKRNLLLRLYVRPFHAHSGLQVL